MWGSLADLVQAGRLSIELRQGPAFEAGVLVVCSIGACSDFLPHLEASIMHTRVEVQIRNKQAGSWVCLSACHQNGFM